MKKLTALFMALAVFSTVSCSAKNSEISTEQEQLPETVNLVQTAYKETKIRLEHRIETPLKIEKSGDSCYFFYKSDKNDFRIAVIDSGLNVVKDEELCKFQGKNITACMNDDGTFWLVRPVTDFEFEYDEYGNMKNLSSFYRHGDVTFMLELLDSSLNVLSSEEIIGLKSDFELSQSELQNLCHYGEDRLLLSYGNGLAVIGTDSSLIDFTHYDQQRIELGYECDGGIVASEYHGYGFMDGETSQLPESLIAYEGELLGIESGAMPGDNGYRAYFVMSGGIYGLTEEEELTLVFDFGESLVQNTDVNCCAAVGDGLFMGAGSQSGLCLYTRRPDDFINDRETFTIWYINGGDGGDKAVDFSKSNDNYIAKVEDKYGRPFSFDDLTKAILLNEAPDVIEFSDSHVYESLINMGALTDMKPFFEQYDGVKEEQLMPNVLEAFNRDGHYYALPQGSFSVGGIMTRKDVVSPDYVNWDINDLMDLYEACPPDMKFMAEGYENTLFHKLLANNLDPWIDRENSVCRFDSPDFVRLLQFCKDNKDSHIEEPLDTKLWLDYKKECCSALRDKKAFLNFDTEYTSGLFSWRNAAGECGLSMDEVSYLNLPGGNGIGYISCSNNVAILETSDCKDGAWAYISYLLTDRELDRAETMYPAQGGNSVNREAFEIMLDSYILKDGEQRMYGSGYSGSDPNLSFSIEYPAFVTKEQTDAYREFVLNCRKLDFGSWDVSNIISEEYMRFDNDEITAEECAEVIQNRAQIFLSEKS